MIHKVYLNIKRIDSNFIWKDNSLYNDLKCLVCKSIVFDPKYCQSCEKIYCNICSGIDKNNKCSNCNRELILKEINSNDELDFLNKIELRCINMDLGCPFIISYKNYQTHIEDCYHSKYKCNGIGCNYINIKQKVLIHCLSCIYVLVECVKCKTSVRRIDLENHLRECRLNLVFCPICKFELTKSGFFDYEIHVCIENFFIDIQEVNNVNRTISIDFDHLKHKLLSKEQKLMRKSEFLNKKRRVIFQIKYKKNLRRKEIVNQSQNSIESFKKMDNEDVNKSILNKSKLDYMNKLKDYRKALNSIISKNTELINNKKKFF